MNSAIPNGWTGPYFMGPGVHIRVEFDSLTPHTRTVSVVYYAGPTSLNEKHCVTLEWDGSTDRPNRITCDCGLRSCIPLRLVRDLERHDALPRE